MTCAAEVPWVVGEDGAGAIFDLDLCYGPLPAELPHRGLSCYMAAMRRLNATRLVWLWMLIPVVAAVEIGYQFWIPRMEPSTADWRKAAVYAKSIKGKEDLIVFAPRFETQAMLYLKEAVSMQDFGRYDITLYQNVIELSVNTAQAFEIVGLPVRDTRAFGRIRVRRYANPKKDSLRYDFISALPRARFVGQSSKRPIFLIDTRFIQRLAIPMTPQKRATSVTFDNVPLDGDIYGYAFIAITDFRSEIYDEDGPLSFAVFVDNRKVGEQRVTKGDAMRPFRFKTGKRGTGTVRFEVRALKPFRHYGFGFTADIRG